MPMLAETHDYVIGGDPDRDTIDLAVLHTGTGAVRAHIAASAAADGYLRVIDWAEEHAPGRRVWALEGTGSFAAGLAEALAQAGEQVVEVGASRRPRGAKNDRIDAVAAARTALAREHQASPRARGLREAIRALTVTRESVLVSRTKAINELKSLIVTAPEHLRARLRGVSLARQLDRVEQLAATGACEVQHRTTVLALRSVAARIRFLSGQVAELDPQIAELLAQHPAGPALLAQPGVGPTVAARVIMAWSHPGRVRDEAAFASLAGVAPLEASSGLRTRHRLNRGGDRALNRALHTVAITRTRCHPPTRAYHERRTAEGKSHKEIRRCLKRAIARQLYRVMQAATRTQPEPSTA